MKGFDMTFSFKLILLQPTKLAVVKEDEAKAKFEERMASKMAENDIPFDDGPKTLLPFTTFNPSEYSVFKTISIWTALETVSSFGTRYSLPEKYLADLIIQGIAKSLPKRTEDGYVPFILTSRFNDGEIDFQSPNINDGDNFVDGMFLFPDHHRRENLSVRTRHNSIILSGGPFREACIDIQENTFLYSDLLIWDDVSTVIEYIENPENIKRVADNLQIEDPYVLARIKSITERLRSFSSLPVKAIYFFD